MMGLWVLLLLLSSLSLTCQGQTFQYSRGWTNGKRSSAGLSYEDVANSNYNQMSKIPINLSTLGSMSEEEFMDKCSPKVLKCLVRVPQILHNPAFLRAMLFASQDHSLIRDSQWNQHIHGADSNDFENENQQSFNKRSLPKAHQSVNSFYENSKLTKAATEDEVTAVNDYEHH